MLEWLNTHIAYWHWLVLGLLLVTAEIFVSGFILFWFGLAALFMGALLVMVDMPITLQLLLWAGLSIALVFLWLKFIRPNWKDRTTSGMAMEALTGQVGSVIDSNIGKSRGRLRFPAPILGEDEWQFMSTSEVGIGERVKVINISGNTLVVSPH
ncbi:NfeD family protein [Microbulbifer sp. CAU 1566]|uniref:NfeD family protein n=1 Tax=unclassified Microbulbifer TaxID=2619833 RepID=UPI001357811A|nr:MULTISPECIES: NfeD family protein [unclassified Microbulbifer]MCK7598273.1 NfeD family protein [Microbulbifer sp. CAU 1566]